MLCNFFILACPGCFWQDRAFEVAERSEFGALESLSSNLVRLAALGALVALVNLAYLAALAFYQKTTAQLLSSRFVRI